MEGFDYLNILRQPFIAGQDVPQKTNVTPIVLIVSAIDVTVIDAKRLYLMIIILLSLM